MAMTFALFDFYDAFPGETAFASAGLSQLRFAAVSMILAGFALSLAFFVVNRPLYVQAKLPGPPRRPLVGILYYAFKHWDHWPVECMRLSRRYHHLTWGGPCFRYGAVFYTDDPVILKHILKDNVANYEKGDVWRRVFDELLGNGIFSADGKIWEAHRKISSRLFSRNFLKHSCQVMARNCSILLDQLDKADGQSIDLQDLFFRLTVDNTAEATFGMQMNCLRSGKQPLFASAFDEIQVLCLARMMDPLFEVKRFFQLGHRERRIRHLKLVLDLFCQGIIQEKKQALQLGEDGAAGHDDLISLFLTYSKHSNETLADGELRDVILNFMVAGRDTTAVGLAWTFYELAQRPDVVDKIVTEVAEICGPAGSHAADYSYEAMGKLTYTHCAAMEGLRLHPPVPCDSKFAIRADSWPDGTRIPAGSLVTYLPLSMGRSELLWGPDAAEFKPERFLTTEPSPYKYSVFNAGPRMCLGKPLALMTMKLVMAHVLPRYHFKDVQGHSGELDWYMVQKMKDGFLVNVSARTPQANLS